MKIKPVLAAYVPVAKMLVQTFGEDCEVVLHDLQDPEHSVVYVENGSVTGRKIGQSFDQLVKQVILSEKLQDDYAANYYFRANGRLIRSSTLLIRDAGGALAGALCINIDTSRITRQIEFLQSFLPAPFAGQEDGEKENGGENAPQHVSQMIENLIGNILANCDPRSLSREDRLKKIKFMDEKGVFLMKGSVDMVAGKMGVSSVTVYSYLDAIRGKR